MIVRPIARCPMHLFVDEKWQWKLACGVLWKIAFNSFVRLNATHLVPFYFFLFVCCLIANGITSIAMHRPIRAIESIAVIEGILRLSSFVRWFKLTELVSLRFLLFLIIPDAEVIQLLILYFNALIAIISWIHLRVVVFLYSLVRSKFSCVFNWLHIF